MKRNEGYMNKDRFFKLIEAAKYLSKYEPVKSEEGTAIKIGHWYYRNNNGYYDLYDDKDWRTEVCNIRRQSLSIYNMIFFENMVYMVYRDDIRITITGCQNSIVIFDNHRNVTKEDYFNFCLLYNLKFTYEEIIKLFGELNNFNMRLYIYVRTPYE